MKVSVKSPLPGKILSIPVIEGDEVKKGQVLFVIESMKMHNDIVSEYNGTVMCILAKEDQAVSTHEDIMEIEKV